MYRAVQTVISTLAKDKDNGTTVGDGPGRSINEFKGVSDICGKADESSSDFISFLASDLTAAVLVVISCDTHDVPEHEAWEDAD